MTDHSLADLADLKDVIGRLWKQAESLESTSKNRFELLHTKVDTWADTNLQLQKTTQTLIEAIVTNSTELARFVESLQSGKLQQVDLSQQISELELQIANAKQHLEQIPQQLLAPSTDPRTNPPGPNEHLISSNLSLGIIQTIERKLSLRFAATTTIGAFLIAIASGCFGWFLTDQNQMRHFNSRAEHALFLNFWQLNSEELLQCLNTPESNHCTINANP